jgi:N-acetylglutamate synthase-like GNAT family acetyltransferase
MLESRGDLTLSDDNSKLQIDTIYRFISGAYWSQGRSREVVEKSLKGSLNIGVYCGDKQVAIARVITDKATFAYISDVFVDTAYRGRSIGKWMVESIVNHPELSLVKKLRLRTEDAHGLYRQFGFKELEKPENWLELIRS